MNVAHIYETPLLLTDTFALEGGAGQRTRLVGDLSLLTGPVHPFHGIWGNRAFEYTKILRHATAHVDLANADDLRSAVALLASPGINWAALESTDFLRTPPTKPAFWLADHVVFAPIVPTEASPLEKRTLVDVAALASGGGLFLFGQVPLVAFVGTGMGLVAIRAIGSATSALWEGARPEVVEFGGDAAAVFLAYVRHRLGIEHRAQIHESNRPEN